MPDTSDSANRALVERFFRAQEQGDGPAVAALMADDMVMEWPQSGERFRGRENVFGAMAAVAVKPTIAGVPRLTGGGNVWVFMAPLLYGDQLQHYVAVIEIGDGRIKRGPGYWGVPFEAQAARAPFLDRDNTAR